MARWLLYRGDEPTTLPDGQTVDPGETVGVDPQLARELLRQPGASGDDGSHPWQPAARPEEG